jgi:hypothetical protein
MAELGREGGDSCLDPRVSAGGEVPVEEDEGTASTEFANGELSPVGTSKPGHRYLRLPLSALVAAGHP